jgi:hypothetical protein
MLSGMRSQKCLPTKNTTATIAARRIMMIRRNRFRPGFAAGPIACHCRFERDQPPFFRHEVVKD